MKGAPHPALIAVTALVYLFLVGPLVIVIGAALSDTTYLTLPPHGLSARWFLNALEVTAFRQEWAEASKHLRWQRLEAGPP